MIRVMRMNHFIKQIMKSSFQQIHFLRMKLKKKMNVKKESKKELISTCVNLFEHVSNYINLSSIWLGSWEKDHFIEKNYETQFLINSIFNNEIKRKINFKKGSITKISNKKIKIKFNTKKMTLNLLILPYESQLKEREEKKNIGTLSSLPC